MNMLQMIQSFINTHNSPFVNNLIGMAKKGDTKGVEEFARNYMKEQGRDFDQEFANFKKQWGSK